MKISLIAAMSKNRVIGYQGKIPWMGMLPTDMRRFRKLTLNNAIIMGRVTAESIGKSLDERTNIVITRQIDFKPRGFLIARDIARALTIAEQEMCDTAWIIGGEQIFKWAINHPDAHEIYLTIVDAEFEGDAFFPEINPAYWREKSRTSFPANDQDKFPHDLVIYERMRR